jgi:hypothetical protein
MTARYGIEIEEKVYNHLLATLERISAVSRLLLAIKEEKAKTTRDEARITQLQGDKFTIVEAVRADLETVLVAVKASVRASAGPLALPRGKGSDNSGSGPGAGGIGFFKLDGEDTPETDTTPAVADGKTYNIHIHLHLPTS